MLAITCLIALSSLAQAAKILIIHPVDVKSHAIVLNPLAQALARRNHSVTIYTCSNYFTSGRNIRVIHLKKTETFKWKTAGLKRRGRLDIIDEFRKAQKYSYEQFDLIFASNEMRNLISSNETFDAMIAYTTFFSQALAAFQHRFNCIAIEFQMHRHNAATAFLTGTPFNAAAVHGPGSWSVSRELNLNERFFNFLEASFMILYAELVTVPSHQTLVDKHLRYPGHESRPSLKQLLYNKSLILVNGHHVLSSQALLSPVEKDVAGITLRSPQPLKGEFNSFLSDAENGFVVMSWGSLIQTIDDEVQKIILDVFAGLKIKVIWKNSSKRVMEHSYPENVLIVNWMPQTDLLDDSRCKLFITHGGFNSLVEAVSNGVPVIVSPFAIDQPRNAMRVVEHGTGLLLSPDNFTTQSFSWAIEEVIGNPKYQIAATKLAKLFNARIMSPLDEAVFWVEYVLAHGTVLQPSSSYVSFFVLWHFDLILIGLLAAFIVFGVTQRLSRFWRLPNFMKLKFE